MRIYKFEAVEVCEMCHNSTAKHKILGQRLSQSQGFRPKSKEGITVSVKRCTNCGLIYSSPQPIPNSILDHYGVSPEEYSWKEGYYEDDPNYFSGQIKDAKEMLDFKPDMKALDIGAGLGKAMKAMQAAGFEVHGLEPSSQFRERAIEWLKIPGDRITLTSVEEVEYPENHFDFITMGAVVEHFYHPAFVIDRAAKWLKPGGIMFIEVPSAQHLVPKLINFYYRLRGTNYVSHLSPMHAPFHLYEYTLESFQKCCDRLGLKLERHHYDVCEILEGPNFIKPLLKKYMEWTKTGMQLTVYLRKP
jgi:2-polyprenyl-3-methyl-5-hydroxy-6-metoxy-1,4-benzoquinol methylase